MNVEQRAMIKQTLRDCANDPITQAALALIEELEKLLEPVEMLLFCPKCGLQHVDTAEKHKPHCASFFEERCDCGAWVNPPHATHTCSHCELLWRPSNRNTTGVKAIDMLEEKHFERIQACYPRYADLKYATWVRVLVQHGRLLFVDLNGAPVELGKDSFGTYRIRAVL